MKITLSGSNGFLLKVELKKLVDQFVAKYGDFGLEKINAEEVSYSKILETVQAAPFLAEKRMVVISSVAANKELGENIQKVLDLLNDDTDLILVEPKFDKRSSIYKSLKKVTDFKEFNEMDDVSLYSWLSDETKRLGGEISSADTRYLVQRVGNNQLKLSNELAKLISYAPKITQQTIDLLTEKTPQSSVFDLMDAAFAGNRKKALQLYDEQRKQKVEPQAILALIGWQLNILAVIKAAGDRNPAEVASEAKLNPYVVRKSQSVANRIKMTDLKETIERTLALDITLKTLSIDADEALQNLIISL